MKETCNSCSVLKPIEGLKAAEYADAIIRLGYYKNFLNFGKGPLEEAMRVCTNLQQIGFQLYSYGNQINVTDVANMARLASLNCSNNQCPFSQIASRILDIAIKKELDEAGDYEEEQPPC